MITDYDLKRHSKPIDELWSQDKMLVRQAVQVRGTAGSGTAATAAAMLDKYAEDWGLERLGNLESESWHFGRVTGIMSHFKVVDMGKFVRQTEENAKRAERSEIRRWPWWRRLFWLPPEGKGSDAP